MEHGISFRDTDNSYGRGSSEEIVGQALKTYTRREDVVLATKLFQPMHPGPGGGGLSGKAVLEQVDPSPRRLDVEYVELLKINRFDPESLVEETMESLHDVVKAGKVRYLEASSLWACRFAKMQHAADVHEAQELGGAGKRAGVVATLASHDGGPVQALCH